MHNGLIPTETMKKYPQVNKEDYEKTINMLNKKIQKIQNEKLAEMDKDNKKKVKPKQP
jgi:glutamyl-tRNA reductase